MRKKFKVVIFLAIFIFVMIALLVSPLFQVRQLDIYGNDVITRHEILEISGLSVGINIFTFNARGAASRLSEGLPYARDVSIVRHFPDRVAVHLIERVPVANLRPAAISTYLLIDSEGVVLAVQNMPRWGLPQITGLSFDAFTVGQPLVVDNPLVFKDILELSSIFRIYDFMPNMVDFSNPRDIVLTKGNFRIYFGSMDDAQTKVRYINEILQQSPTDRGSLNIRNFDNPSLRFIP